MGNKRGHKKKCPFSKLKKKMGSYPFFLKNFWVSIFLIGLATLQLVTSHLTLVTGHLSLVTSHSTKTQVAIILVTSHQHKSLVTYHQSLVIPRKTLQSLYQSLVINTSHYSFTTRHQSFIEKITSHPLVTSHWNQSLVT